MARDPGAISFGDIVRAMQGPIALVPCASVNFYERCGDCHDEASCAIRKAFAMVRDESARVLEGVSLKSAAQWEEEMPATR